MPDMVRDDELGPEEGGGPPPLMPWTLVVEGEDWSADLEHGAPLPRIGELVEYLAEDGSRRTLRVVDVIHTVQSSANERPPVRDEEASPNATVDRPVPRTPRELRAGLPRVIVSADRSRAEP